AVHRHIVVPAVIAALELDDLLAPGIGAGKTQGVIGRFRSAAAEGHLIGTGDRLDQQFGNLDFQLEHSGADKIEVFADLADRYRDSRMTMAEDIRPEGTMIVDVPNAIGIVEIGPGSAGKGNR